MVRLYELITIASQILNIYTYWFRSKTYITMRITMVMKAISVIIYAETKTRMLK